jgi:hypothetical protein
MLAETPKPHLKAFVGSSSESRGIAEAILRNLEHKVEITCWYHDFFEPHKRKDSKRVHTASMPLWAGV